ncbi:MAG: HlyD family efflux transporter periplasmic adaptor subunit [Deltaproteobacteria bacterium]|nr:MAG: HlyD family efflux transporter periplasmic adaptor subunit [Deltaproteobacteria bacterium]
MSRLVLAAVAASWLGCHHGAGEPVFAEVVRDDLVVGVEVSGALEAVDSTDIKPPPLPGVWNFKIASLAPEGQEVKPGDPVIGFDASDQIRELENMKNEAEAAQKKLDKRRDDAQLARRDDELKIAEAEAGLHKATLKTDAPADLVASVAQREVQLDEQSAQLGLEAARQHAAQVQRSSAEEIQRLTEKASYARQRVATLEHTIASMQVTAPRAGTIVYPANEQGEKHKLGDSVWRMEDVMQIVGLGQMAGSGQVDEVDMARLAEHQSVVLRLDAMPDVQLHGTVTSIAASVQAKSNTDPSKIVKLKVAIDATKVSLRPGMRFRGQVETEHLRGVVQVPADAVFVTPGGPVAYRKAGGDLERVRLGLGRRTPTRIEVVSGLAPGDRVSRSDPGAP